MCVFRFVIVLLYVISAYGQISRLSECPSVKTVSFVNWNKMEGRWYRMSEFPERDPRLQNQTCLSEIKEVNNDGTISVFASWLNTFTGQFFQDMFVGRIIPDAENPGMASFDGTLDSVPQYQYSIMAVQYDNFHLLYGCEDGKGRQDSLEMFLFQLVSVLLCILSSSGQVTRPGGCPNVKTVSHVNWKKTEGRWYRISEFPERDPRLQNQTCISEIKEVNSDGTISVFASWLNTFTNQFFKDVFVGKIIPDPSNPGLSTFEGTLESTPRYLASLMQMQYDNFHLLYACEDGGGQQTSLETALILSRRAKPMKKSTLQKIYFLLRTNGVDPDNFIFVDHSDCPNLQ
ncbi:apolipoprotein D-like isoform X2 [Mytilus californianus]|uniref:apolipoprotein D-like isoform X1 n=1 Tax=Mytilus californianus TaxID=6549 RepID=UPI0022469ABC|nr:apolipoprotein D-like isoform X1 [Mytilus californianus]XP_052085484.1 apolipoprotein D-like isoform X2 [Mytilus californianus]